MNSADSSTMPSPSERRALLVRLSLCILLALTGAGRLAVSLADYRSLIGADFYNDDAFYALQLAKNIAHGHGMTVDTHSTTSGFQPLYVLMLVPVFMVAGSDPIAPIHVSASVLSIFSVGTGLLMFALSRRLAGPVTGLFSLALWACSPYFLLHSVNGLETGVAGFFALLVVWLYLRWRSGQLRGRWQTAGLGVAGGLAILARIDLVILVAVLALDSMRLFIVGKDSRCRGQQGHEAIVVVGTMLATWGAWGVISVAHTGDFLPRSGAASRLVAFNYGWVDAELRRVWSKVLGDTEENLLIDPDNVPISFYLDVATKGVFLFLCENPVLAPLRVNKDIEARASPSSYIPFEVFARYPLCALCAAAVCIAAIVGLELRWGMRWRKAVKPDGAAFGAIVCVYIMVHLLAYTMYSPSHWYFARYLFVPIILSTICFACFGAWVWGRMWEEPRWVWLGWGVICAVLACQFMVSGALRKLEWGPAQAQNYLASLRSLEPLVPQEEKLGVFQAGVFCYFSDLDIVNLDGKVNAEACRAIEEKRLHEYAREQGICYVADWEPVLLCLWLRYLPPDYATVTFVAHEQDYGFVLARVDYSTDSEQSAVSPP